MSDALFSLGYFSGINTVDDPARLAPTPVKIGEGYKAAYPLVAAENLDIDNTYALTSRIGSVKKLSGTAVHSFWTNGTLAFFIDGTKLYLLNADYSKTEILTGLTLGNRMSYTQVNDRIYMTNGAYIGYYTGAAMSSLVVPVETYKVVLPAGQRIAYHKGRLLVAKGRVLYMADALCDHYDVRTGFRVFENDITMVCPVDDGVYVADGKTWFLMEKRAFADDPAEYKKDWVSGLDCIPFSDTLIDGAYVGEGVEGNVAMWATSEGVSLGNNKGVVKIVTPNYIMPPGVMAAAAVRNIDGLVHYLATIN
jgi:hypothetical protein